MGQGLSLRPVSFPATTGGTDGVEGVRPHHHDVVCPKDPGGAPLHMPPMLVPMGLGLVLQEGSSSFTSESPRQPVTCLSEMGAHLSLALPQVYVL